MLSSSFWLETLLGCAAIAAVGGVLLFLNWLFATRKTDPSLLETNLIQRLWRSYRWIWFRIGLGVFGWPHLVDMAVGTSKAPVGQTPGQLVWQHGPATLHKYGNSTGGAEAVLIVHSLVSKPWILDLAPGRSFVEFLIDEGFDVFLLDWGDLTTTDSGGLTGCAETLMLAEKQVIERSASQRIHLVGYCLGGLVCLLRASARRHPDIASITLLATPVDFAIRVALQPLIAHRLFFKPVYFLDGSGCVPAPALRESFHLLRPRAIRTVANAWRHRRDRAFREVYDPLARWVWEHRPLGGRVFFELVDLFRTNALLKGSMIVAGEVARLEDVGVPVLNLIAERDHIVPSASSEALSTVEGLDITTVDMASGHVSMVSGTTARTTTWPTIARWIRAKSEPHGTAAQG